MQAQTRVAFGYALLGLTIGLFAFPWIYLVGVRGGWLVPEQAAHAALLMGVILVPGIVLGLVGHSKGRQEQAGYASP